ncbi:D-alanyl-D-alanine carboxypeptidase family protein [Phycicoccus sp. BSK3Z-2]|uniref:D-alanyl-D-alanine carboxypeptidase family protein n=1 Tax=Phycicoccus avicenniae TaxID=2828860 RepID=A0A941D581_9MICO|nr:M15 family metallopeptidase [Phycicoccus avicenniae]MBR7742334.1 D-alanyl-D-alanine carboxypeptidase family protein [Phycicoccus avicenniae]
MRGAAVTVVAALAVLGSLAPAVADSGDLTFASDETASATPSASPTPTPTPTSTPSPSATRTPSPTTSSPAPSPSTPPSSDDAPPPPEPESGHAEPDAPAPLAGEVLAAQIAEAERIAAILEESSSEVAVEMRRMDRLSDRSNDVLESLAAATDAEDAASEESSQAHRDLISLEARLAKARAIMRSWAFDVYSGGEHADLEGMLDAMQSEEDEAGNPLGDLAYLTDQRTRAVAEVRSLTAEQERLTEAADEAEKTAREARTRIEKDSERLETLLKAQRARVGELRKLQMAEVDKAGPVANILVGARTPEAKAAAERLRAALSGAVVDTADVGKPCTDETGTFANGLFPSSALCPVWRQPGERLSPEAAASFNALSKAYAAQTGTPLCVTDSYRSLPEQVAIKGSHGHMAATPGTSRHGLGRAVDLCGGVQDFGSPAHQWMRQNAPLYGWFHPSWAGAGGSLPEPWHWEFAG